MAAACGCVKGLTSRDKAEESARLMTLSDSDEALLDTLHYFGVYDGHGGVDAAKHCAQQMHIVVSDCIHKALGSQEADPAAEAVTLDEVC